MKFLIGIPTYKRMKIVEIQMLYNSNILIPYIKAKGVQVDLLVVGSDDEDKQLFEDYHNLVYVHMPNILSNKFNYLVNYAKDQEYDYLMTLGSDDLMPTSLFDDVFELVKENGYIASPSQMWMCDTNTSIIYKWRGYGNGSTPLKKYGLGSGRIYSKKTLDNLSRTPFGENMMNSMETTIAKELDVIDMGSIELNVFVDAESYLFCLKSDENIWKISSYTNTSSIVFDFTKKYFDWIPNDVKEKILKLNNMGFKNVD